MRRFEQFFCASLLTVVLLPGILGAPARAADDALGIILAKYRCPVMTLLADLKRQSNNTESRYLVLHARSHPNLYAQCLFDDDSQHVLCEAASGFYYEPTREALTIEKRSILRALGFSTDDSHGNFSFERAVPNGDALYDLAGTLLETLVRVYDFGADDVLVYTAPLTKQTAVAPAEDETACIARMGTLPRTMPLASR